MKTRNEVANEIEQKKSELKRSEQAVVTSQSLMEFWAANKRVGVLTTEIKTLVWVFEG